MKLWCVLYRAIPWGLNPAHPDYREEDAVDSELSDATPLDCAAFQKFASLAHFVPQREINWIRTFARQGLDPRDYDEIGTRCEGKTLSYMFERDPGVRAAVPKSVVFSMPNTPLYDPDLTAPALQGQIITYLKQIAHVRWEPLSSVHYFAFEEHMRARFTADRAGYASLVISELTEAQGWLARLAPADRKAYEVILSNWDPAFGFLRFELVAS